MKKLIILGIALGLSIGAVIGRPPSPPVGWTVCKDTCGTYHGCSHGYGVLAVQRQPCLLVDNGTTLCREYRWNLYYCTPQSEQGAGNRLDMEEFEPASCVSTFEHCF